ncbi:hypothetical protein [Flavobacterium sp. 140616W15]|uniref:hypothetical protein n=1 Tax=Flavobacterium sp. 140616W15 TaxID=2478552 RepID=UPI000F0C1D31|nr:hypothetical protein [Flavobacterium sp. 140616W15]AYN04682.1 hypothetical protein EAG11_11280 [Flavobacterium sp. 140616W15]
MINKIIVFLLLLLFINCSSKKIDINDEYRSYQIAKGLDPSVKRSFQHFKDFLTYKDSIKKQNVIKSPFLKVNQVYIYYSQTETQTFGTFIDEGKQSVTFVIYSDEGRFCLSTFDLSSTFFSPPENGIIKLIKPVSVEDFGGFEITNDFIKTSKRNKTPFKEWYDHVNGSIKNDVIYFTEGYIGKEYKFEKKWYAVKKKFDFKEVYQPNLKTEKFKDSYGLTYFRVTGEFNVE